MLSLNQKRSKQSLNSTFINELEEIIEILKIRDCLEKRWVHHYMKILQMIMKYSDFGVAGEINDVQYSLDHFLSAINVHKLYIPK